MILTWELIASKKILSNDLYYKALKIKDLNELWIDEALTDLVFIIEKNLGKEFLSEYHLIAFFKRCAKNTYLNVKFKYTNTIKREVLLKYEDYMDVAHEQQNEDLQNIFINHIETKYGDQIASVLRLRLNHNINFYAIDRLLNKHKGFSNQQIKKIKKDAKKFLL